MNLTELKKRFTEAFNHFLDTLSPIEERAISVSDIATQANQLLWEQYPDEWYWIGDIVEDGGNLYGILSKDGRLWRTLITVNGSNVSISPLEEVEVQYTPVSFRSRAPQIIRQADGSRLWLRVVSAAVLLRGAKFEIDSTELMDSFLEHIERTGNYPIASYWHTGEALRLGESIALWRDDKVLCEVGRFDNTELAQRMADHIEANPEFWGTSIEYYDDESAAEIEVIGGTKVIVHRKGVLTSCDFLPESVAASLFTGGVRAIQRGHTMTEEQKRILKDAQIPDDVIADFEAKARSANDEAAGMISREAEEAEGELEGTLEGNIELELTDEVVGELGDALADRFATAETVGELQTEIAELRSLLEAATAEIATVRGIATATDESRRKALSATLPKSPTITLVGRNKGKPEPEDDDDDDDEPQVVSAHTRTTAPASAAAQFFAASKRK